MYLRFTFAVGEIDFVVVNPPKVQGFATLG